ncbi:MAG: hypothetical protein ACRER2_16285, partial [Methylococcales bacterium]
MSDWLGKRGLENAGRLQRLPTESARIGVPEPSNPPARCPNEAAGLFNGANRSHARPPDFEQDLRAAVK